MYHSCVSRDFRDRLNRLEVGDAFVATAAKKLWARWQKILKIADPRQQDKAWRVFSQEINLEQKKTAQFGPHCIFSCALPRQYRVLGILSDIVEPGNFNTIVFFFIGSHADYSSAMSNTTQFLHGAIGATRKARMSYANHHNSRRASPTTAPRSGPSVPQRIYGSPPCMRSNTL